MPFFQGEAGYHCVAKDEKYDGFEGHIIINSQGIIPCFTFADASVDERDEVQDLTDGISGLWIGDKG